MSRKKMSEARRAEIEALPSFQHLQQIKEAMVRFLNHVNVAVVEAAALENLSLDLAIDALSFAAAKKRRSGWLSELEGIACARGRQRLVETPELSAPRSKAGQS